MEEVGSWKTFSFPFWDGSNLGGAIAVSFRECRSFPTCTPLQRGFRQRLPIDFPRLGLGRFPGKHQIAGCERCCGVGVEKPGVDKKPREPLRDFAKKTSSEAFASNKNTPSFSATIILSPCWKNTPMGCLQYHNIFKL